MDTKNLMKITWCAAFAVALAWAALGVCGAAIGSDDDITRSFGAAVRMAVGAFAK